MTLDSHGYRVHDDDDDDPILLDASGVPVDTWRETVRSILAVRGES